MPSVSQKFRFCILILFFVCSSVPAYSQETLRVLAWPGYADADFVHKFEQRFNVKVNVSIIDSDDTMWDRLSADEGEKFDVFAVNSAQLQRYIDKGISVPIDLSNIPNANHQLPRFKQLYSMPGIMRNDNLYAIPYTYSEMGLIYDRNVFKQPPNSISLMWDPKYQGRILMYEGSEHNFSLAALSLGLKNPFQIPETQFSQVSRQVVALRRNALSYYEKPEEATQLFIENHAVLLFANYGSQQVKMLEQAQANIAYVIPKEGALAWLDCWSVTRNAKDKTLAEAWINFTLEPQMSHALTERQGLANTLEESTVLENSDKLIWLQRVEDMDKRKRLWDRIMSGDVLDDF